MFQFEDDKHGSYLMITMRGSVVVLTPRKIIGNLDAIDPNAPSGSINFGSRTLEWDQETVSLVNTTLTHLIKKEDDSLKFALSKCLEFEQSRRKRLKEKHALARRHRVEKAELQELIQNQQERLAKKHKSENEALLEAHRQQTTFYESSEEESDY